MCAGQGGTARKPSGLARRPVDAHGTSGRAARFRRSRHLSLRAGETAVAETVVLGKRATVSGARRGSSSSEPVQGSGP